MQGWHSLSPAGPTTAAAPTAYPCNHAIEQESLQEPAAAQQLCSKRFKVPPMSGLTVHGSNSSAPSAARSTSSATAPTALLRFMRPQACAWSGCCRPAPPPSSQPASQQPAACMHQVLHSRGRHEPTQPSYPNGITTNPRTTVGMTAAPMQAHSCCIHPDATRRTCGHHHVIARDKRYQVHRWQEPDASHMSCGATIYAIMYKG